MNVSERAKIAFIVQRYGLEINGGAELHCRLLSEKLNEYYDVCVLTSCAKNYQTWHNEYPEGKTTINGIEVLRFPVKKYRDNDRSSYRFIRRRKVFQKVLKGLHLLSWFEERFPAIKPTHKDFVQWLWDQGCAVPDLISYLKENQHQYKALIFFTYLYYPTAVGLEVAPSKSIFIPTAHDEPAIYIPFYKRVFNLPAAIIYNTESEKTFVNTLFKNQNIDSAIGGIGVELPGNIPFIDIKKLYSLTTDYLVYIGRIEAGKGCDMLIQYFQKFKSQNKSVTLVLAGEVLMPLPDDPEILSIGFISDEEKINLLQQSVALVIPSLYESLSMVTLEAMSQQIPVIANGQCEVLKMHIEKSKGGYLFYNYQDFEKAITALLNDQDLQKRLGRLGREYVESNYDWKDILNLFTERIEAMN